MRRTKEVVSSTREDNQKYKIQIDTINNKCILYPTKAEKECQMYAVVHCETEMDCLYELFFDLQLI